MANNITSADVAVRLSVEELYPSGFDLEVFGTDAGVVVDAVTDIETRMSIDGHLSAGYTPVPKTVNFTIEPYSPAYDYILDWARRQQSSRKVFAANMTIRVPAINRTFRFLNGYLTQHLDVPAIQKTLQPITFQVTFERIE